MTDNIVAIHDGRLSLSRITYFCDLQQRSGLEIPLGVIAELNLGPVRVLGLIAQAALTEVELRQVGRLIRDDLANPFDYLKKEFDWAWINTASGEALAELASRHTDSLFFTPPRATPLRRALSGPSDGDAIKRILCDARDADFHLMMAEMRPGYEVRPDFEESAKLAA